MINAYKNYWKNWKDYLGVTGVREYWWAFLCHAIAVSILAFIAAIIDAIAKTQAFSTIVSIISAVASVPFIAMTVRRLRDTGRDWKYIFIGFIPIVGEILLIIACFQRTGKYGDVVAPVEEVPGEEEENVEETAEEVKTEE